MLWPGEISLRPTHYTVVRAGPGLLPHIPHHYTCRAHVINTTYHVPTTYDTGMMEPVVLLHMEKSGGHEHVHYTCVAQ